MCPDDEKLPWTRPEPDTPEPPPVPATHPAGQTRIREAMRIAASFYVEALFTSLVVIALYLVAGALDQTFAPVVLGFAGIAGFGACFYRLVLRVIRARAKGKPPLQATVVFWAAILTPVFIGVWYVRGLVRDFDPWKLKQAEAKTVLARALRAEQEFHREFGRYTYNMKELGLEREPGARYVLGFPAACTAKFSVEGAKYAWDLLDFTMTKDRKLEVAEFFKKVKAPADCVDPRTGFEIYAVTPLKENTPLDTWRIDDERKLVNVQRGY